MDGRIEMDNATIGRRKKIKRTQLFVVVGHPSHTLFHYLLHAIISSTFAEENMIKKRQPLNLHP
jgi:hypothetical protein